MKNFESKFEQTGDIFEWQFIGQVDTKNPEYQKALQEAQKEEEKEGLKNDYIRFKKAVELAKKFQPYDPANPDKPFARDIRIALQELLKLTSDEEMDRVKFYTASGTPLDKFHGVDAFIEYEESPQKDPYRATFDFTINPQKQAYKSGIVVIGEDLPDPKLNPKEYLQKIEEFAAKVLSKMAVREVQEKKKIL